MKLIVGLGNPGEKYKNNRHNVGQKLIDILQSENKNLEGIILAKTDVFMNDSGSSVKKIIQTRKIKPENLYIVHDDLDIKLGEFKIQFGKGPKVHNGITSVENSLGTTEFWRIRIGVDNRDPNNRIIGEKYVLEDFTSEELDVLNISLKKCADFLKTNGQLQTEA